MSTPKSQIASFDVDAQKGFTPICPDELPVTGGDEIVEALNFMASLASFRVGSKDAHAPNAKWVVPTKAEMFQLTGLVDADRTWVSHCVPGTLGFELLDGLPGVMDYDFFVWKGIEPDLHPYGACYQNAGRRSTGVIEVLRINGITKVLVGGLALDYCVKSTAIELAQAGFEVVVYIPACRGIDDATVTQALVEMSDAGVVFAADTFQLQVLAYDTDNGQQPL
jgi:nicotinamidase/pyrazinamidase